MRSRGLFLSVVTLATACGIACTHGSLGRSPSPNLVSVGTPTLLPWAANLTGAEQIGIQISTTVAGCTPAMGCGELVALDAAGNPTPILSVPFAAFFFLVTPANVIVQGLSVGNTCALLAIPRQAGSNTVSCLLSGAGDLGPQYGDPLAVANAGNDVFFLGIGENPTDLRYWSGLPDSPVELLDQRTLTSGPAPQGIAFGPYVARDGSHVCVAASIQSAATPGITGAGLVCGTRSGVFAPISSDLIPGPAGPGLQVGNTLFWSGVSVDLESLASSSIPNANPNSGVPAPGGGAVSLGGDVGGITLFQAPATETPLLRSTSEFVSMVGAANQAVAWATRGAQQPVGGSDVRQIDLTTFTVSENLVGTLGLTTATGVALAAIDTLQVDGIDASGLPKSSHIDGHTGAISPALTGGPEYLMLQAIP